MSQLISMRNRMKAVGTIKKITHAMRLISMSTHARLRDQEPFMQRYAQEIERIFLSLYSYLQKKKKLPTCPILNPPQGNKTLVLLIGSQKGLCGNFNDAIFTKFQREFPAIDQSTADIISVGKKASDYLHLQKISVTQSFDTVGTTKITALAHELTHAITDVEQPYSRVVMLSNYPKTFFASKQRVTQLMPIELPKGSVGAINLREYVWELDPIAIVQQLAQLHITVTIERTIFESLLAEQASRFVSMDSSTRNAQEVLDTMKLQYNKLRQAKITRELTELSSCFQINIRS